MSGLVEVNGSSVRGASAVVISSSYQIAYCRPGRATAVRVCSFIAWHTPRIREQTFEQALELTRDMTAAGGAWSYHEAPGVKDVFLVELALDLAHEPPVAARPAPNI